MEPHSPIYLFRFGVAIYCRNNCALHYCYLSSRESMWRLLWATYSVCVLHWEVEPFDLSRVSNRGSKKIRKPLIQNTRVRYCTVQYFWLENWTALRAEWRCVPSRRTIYTNVSVEHFLRRTLIWRLLLVLLLVLSHLTCYYIWFLYPVSFDVNLEIEEVKIIDHMTIFLKKNSILYKNKNIYTIALMFILLMFVCSWNVN